MLHNFTGKKTGNPKSACVRETEHLNQREPRLSRYNIIKFNVITTPVHINLLEATHLLCLLFSKYQVGV